MSANPTPSAVAGAASILADIENGEDLIPLSELGNQPFVLKRRGRKPHKSVWFRWVSHGLRGVKLETIRAGTCLATTRGSVLRFYARLSRAGTGASLVATSRALRRDEARIDRELDRAGIR